VERSTGLLGSGWRRLVVAGTVAVAVLVAGGVWIFDARGADEAWVRETAIPEIEELVRTGSYEDAWTVARRALEIAPEDPDLARLLAQFTWLWSGFETDPPGARVLRRAYVDPEAPWEDLGTTPLDTIRLPAFTFSALRLERDGYRPVDMVPDIDDLAAGEFPVVRLDPAERLPEEIVRIPGWRGNIDGETVELGDFFMNRYPVTNREYKRFVDAGGYRDPQYWDHPFVLDGDTLSWEEGMARFTDRTGRSGPSTWEVGSYPEGREDYPVGGVSWYEAAAYANFAGRSLPSVHHWRRAYGSNVFRQEMIALANLQSEGPEPVGRRAAMAPYGTFDMAGNVREWCFNEVGEDRFILGGGWNEPQYMAMVTQSTQPAFDRSPANGIRLVAYLDHTEGPELGRAFRPVVPVPVPDFRAMASPPSDDVFEVYRAMFAYDPTPLEPRIEGADTARHWVRQTISFDAAYGGERVLLHLYLPRTSNLPLQTVVYWPGLQATWLASIDQGPAFTPDFIVRSGRAVALPVLKGTLERPGDQPPMGSHRYRDLTIQRVQDVIRTIDYLETRDDLDTDRLAYYSFSWGGWLAPVPLALEPRFQVAVLHVAGFMNVRSLPEVDPLTYVSRVEAPVLVVNGRFDAAFPLETHARPFFDLLGTAPEDKRFFVAEGGHVVPRPDLIRETLDWLDRYLGPVEG
jgi:eukaryotic-like serine/threonine-protein kinase